MLVLLELLRLEPESNLLLGVLDAVRAVADVAANILYKSQSHAHRVLRVTGGKLSYNGEVTTDGARGGGKRVGGTEDG